MKTILKKENGEIIEIIRTKQVSDTPYLSEEEKCFIDILKEEKPNIKKEKLKEIINTAHYIVRRISYADKFNKNIKTLFYTLSMIQTEKDLDNFINYIIKVYKDTIKEPYQKYFKISKDKSNISNIKALLMEHKQLITSVVIKKLIKTYITSILLSLEIDQISTLQNFKNESAYIDEILNFLNIDLDEASIYNGIKNMTEKILHDTIDEIYDRKQIHLCWALCENATPSHCEKIFDKTKKNISQYDFIIEGYQTFKESGQINKFVVTKCSNYKKMKHKKTNLTIRQLNEIKDNLATIYYDTITPEEAYQIAYEQNKRNSLKLSK